MRFCGWLFLVCRCKPLKNKMVFVSSALDTGKHMKIKLIGKLRRMRLDILKRLRLFWWRKISYGDLVEIYWAQTDPTDALGNLRRSWWQLSSCYFYSDESQKEIADASKAALQASGRFKDPIITAIEPVQPFYVAEDYHQVFTRKSWALLRWKQRYQTCIFGG